MDAKVSHATALTIGIDQSRVQRDASDTPTCTLDVSDDFRLSRGRQLPFLVPMAEETTFLTPAAYEKMQQELEYLKTVGRNEIADRIAEARSHGDLRENADYDAAKNEQGLMESRIRKLEHLLRTAEVKEVVDSGKVEVGSVVKVVDSDGDEMEYFVAPQENKVPGMLLASPTSPLGAAMIGARVGDEVAYEAPAGTLTVTIRSVRPYEA